MGNQKKFQQVLALLSVKWKRRDNLMYCKLIAKDEEIEVLPDRNKQTHINFDSPNCLGFIFFYRQQLSPWSGDMPMHQHSLLITCNAHIPWHQIRSWNW